MMKKTTGDKLTKEGIISTLEKHKYDINKYGIRKIGLFGSFASKNYNDKSDIDFIVVFKKPTFDNYMELKFFLEKLFHRKVDLVIEDNIKPALKHVKDEVLYAKGLSALFR